MEVRRPKMQHRVGARRAAAVPSSASSPRSGSAIRCAGLCCAALNTVSMMPYEHLLDQRAGLSARR